MRRTKSRRRSLERSAKQLPAELSQHFRFGVLGVPHRSVVRDVALPKGAVLSLEQGWDLACVWYGEDRRDPTWRRQTLEETEAVFANLGFTSAFWNLR